MKESIKKYAGLGVCLFVLFLAVHYWETAAGLFRMLLAAAQPLILGAVMAYIINLLMRFYEDRLLGRAGGALGRIRRPLCILLALASLLLILAFVVWMILPELWASVQMLFSEVPDLIMKYVAFLEEKYGIDWAFLDEIFLKLESLDWKSIARNVLEGVGGAVGAAVSVVGSVAGAVVSFVVALVFAVYILLGKEMLARGCMGILDTYLKPVHRDQILYVLRTFDRCFGKFIVGQCIEAVILGVLCILGMMVLRIPYATMVGTLIGFTALIPVAGAYIGGIVGVLLIATVSPVKAVVFVVFLVILQQVEGNLIYPRVVGSSIGLPGIVVLAAITVGGGVLGIPGMLLGVPIAAALYQIVREDIDRRRQAKTVQPEVSAPVPAEAAASGDAAGQAPPAARPKTPARKSRAGRRKK